MDGDAAKLAEIERRRKAQKTSDRTAREKNFRHKYPERFVPGDEEGGREGGGGGSNFRDDREVGGRGFGGPGRGGRGGGRHGGAGGGGDGSRGGDDESVHPQSLPDVKSWLRSREASLPAEEREKRRARAEVLTRQIAQAAKDKQLGRAVLAYRRLVTHERLIPTSYTYASLINAYVNSGHMPGASAMLRRMKAVPGMAPNVVVYTTMLKGHMLAGDVEAAEALLAEMPRQKPPVPLDARAVNTFLRTCQRAGDTPRAWAAYQRMVATDSPDGAPAIAPDDATYKLVARLLAQGLRLADLQVVIARAKADAERAKGEGPGGGGASAPPCQFWLGGCCDRGAGCQYFHDPAVTQRADVERLDALAAMHVNLAHAAALLREHGLVKSAIETATEALDTVDKLGLGLVNGGGDGGVGGGGADATGDDQGAGAHRAGVVGESAGGGASGESSGSATYKRTTRAELRLELKRIGGFRKRVKKGDQEQPDLVDYLSRALVFSSRIVEEGEEGTGVAGDKSGHGGQHDGKKGGGKGSQGQGNGEGANGRGVKDGSGGDGGSKEEGKSRDAEAGVKEKDLEGGATEENKTEKTQPGKKEVEPPEDPEALTEMLFQRLRVAYGLDPACERSDRAPCQTVRDRLRRSIARDGTVDFAALFSGGSDDVGGGGGSKKEKKHRKDTKRVKHQDVNKGKGDGDEGSPSRRPVKLEICAGNGDWAVAQAKADPGSDWVALELRHDRVYSIFSRAVCEGARNLCAMGGDAARVMRRNVRPAAVSHVFINFPEPPHHSGDAAADNRHHLLTPAFFRHVHAALEPGGGLTVFSDNHKYMQSLARTLAELLHTGSGGGEAGDGEAGGGGAESTSSAGDDKVGEPMFSAEAAHGTSTDGKGEATFENVDGVRLYHGLPGKGTGHMVYEQSYFDRFWEQGAHTSRFFMLLSKN